MQLSAIWIYPVKSLYGIALQEAAVLARGLAADRRWMVVDENGRFLTQREHPGMVMVGTELFPGSLVLFDRNRPENRLQLPEFPEEAEPAEVEVWDDTVRAQAYGGAFSAWFKQVTGLSARLVRMAETAERQIDLKYSAPGRHVSFADGYPVLVTTDAAIETLNRRLADPVDMRRFRPNLVVSGAPAHDEDDWTSFTVGPVHFSGVKKCARCPVTTIDPDRGERGREPLKALGTYRRAEGKVFFGQNAIPESEGRVRIGDPVAVLARKGGATPESA